MFPGLICHERAVPPMLWSHFSQMIQCLLGGSLATICRGRACIWSYHYLVLHRINDIFLKNLLITQKTCLIVGTVTVNLTNKVLRSLVHCMDWPFKPPQMLSWSIFQPSVSTVLSFVKPIFSTFLLQRNLAKMFALLMEPYAMIQVSVLLSVMKQMCRNVASMFYFYVSAETLAATRGTPVGKHCVKPSWTIGSLIVTGHWAVYFPFPWGHHYSCFMSLIK